MPTYINGREETSLLLERLERTIQANSDITSEQNRLLVRYTRWLLVLTTVLGAVAVLQLAAMFLSWE